MKRIISLISFLLAVLNVTAEDIYVKMTSLEDIDLEGTYLMATTDYVGKAISGNYVKSLTAKLWFNSTKTAFTVPNYYSPSGLFYLNMEVVNASSNIYAFKIKSTGTYLSNTSNTYLGSADNYSSKRAQWIIEKTSDGLTVRSNYTSSYYIRTRSTGDFYCSSSSSAAKVLLYKKVPASESITIGESGYATHVSSYSLDFSAQTGITPFIVTQSSNTAAIMESVESIPAKTPVVVSGTPGTYSIPVTISPATITGNLLYASDGTVKGDGKTIYALGNLSSGVGFYIVDTDVVIPSGRCYLRIEENESSPAYIRMAMSNTTDISEIKTRESDSYYHSLSGQRVVHPRKGIYIYKGKKVVIR